MQSIVELAGSVKHSVSDDAMGEGTTAHLDGDAKCRKVNLRSGEEQLESRQYQSECSTRSTVRLTVISIATNPAETIHKLLHQIMNNPFSSLMTFNNVMM